MDARLAKLVEAAGLDAMTPASENPDNEDEWSSICLVDLRKPGAPRVAGWRARNFVYPASTYKLYVLGEAIRQVCTGKIGLDDHYPVEPHNVRSGSRLAEGDEPSLSEVLRLMMMYSDNTAANVAIDIVDRRNATALMHAMGCQGSEITRKYLSRDLEDPGYADVPGTTSSALHFATFLYAVETACIGGGRGRGLIKAYMATAQTGQDRMRAGLPPSATLYNKTGTWNTFSSQVAIVEDGEAKYILCVLTAQETEVASPRIAKLTADIHAWMSEKSVR
ncbi:MAG: beta-lactamase class [Candidatus Sumerlaeota bacterium]|nr:beta-lactamase class [Candidatus Sumerlaeota bacterium]